MKKLISLVGLLTLGLAIASPLANAMESGSEETSHNGTQEMRHEGTQEKAKHAETDQGKGKLLSACLKAARQARASADKTILETNMAALKTARTTYNSEVKAIRATFAASSKDSAARAALKAALKTARTKFLDTRHAAGNTFRADRKATQATWKVAHDKCIAAK